MRELRCESTGTKGCDWARATLLAALGLWLAALGLAGCTYERVVHDPWGDFRDLAAKSGRAADGPTAGDLSMAGEGYAIQVRVFEGRNHPSKAEAFAAKMLRDYRVADVWTKTFADQSVVYRGHYDSPDTREARVALLHVQRMEVDGRSLRDAKLTPVGLGGDAHDPLNLARVRGQNFYTLQIGYYDAAFGPGFREAAVEAAKALRADGTEAYYLHSDTMSLLTVGLFTEKDFDWRELQPGSQVRAYGPKMHAAQEKFPYNLGNGRTLIEKREGQASRTQASFIVPLS